MVETPAHNGKTEVRFLQGPPIKDFIMDIPKIGLICIKKFGKKNLTPEEENLHLKPGEDHAQFVKIVFDTLKEN